MWIALLLITQVSCEWVEISQQHYRKPVRVTYQQTTTTGVYANETISTATFRSSSADHRKSITGKKRIEVSSSNKGLELETDKNTFIHEVTTERSYTAKDVFGTIERETNIGKVKRVQLANVPVKSSSFSKNDSAARSKHVYTTHDGFFEDISDGHEEEHRRVSFINFRKQYISTTEVNQFSSDVTRTPFKNYAIVTSEKPNPFVTGNMKDDTEDNFNSYHKDPDDIFELKINRIAHIESVKKPNTEIVLETSNTNDRLTKNPRKPDFNPSKNTFTRNEHPKIYGNNNDQHNKANPTVKTIQNDDSEEFVGSKANRINTPTEETLTPNTKAKAMDVIFKVMKTVADTISKNSHRSLSSKIKYLHELKDTLLDNIENRIDSIWPDDGLRNEGRRRTRLRRDTARGHVEFPSSESALMTISFLTFAVFLIKLVLQVIQTYKNKTMMVAPLVVATAGRAAGRRLRANDKHTN